MVLTAKAGGYQDSIKIIVSEWGWCHAKVGGAAPFDKGAGIRFGNVLLQCAIIAQPLVAGLLHQKLFNFVFGVQDMAGQFSAGAFNITLTAQI